jgi:hypothetical protein
MRDRDCRRFYGVICWQTIVRFNWRLVTRLLGLGPSSRGGGIEAFHVCILSGLTGLNEPQLDLVLVGPLVQRLAREFGTLIGSNHLR